MFRITTQGAARFRTYQAQILAKSPLPARRREFTWHFSRRNRGPTFFPSFIPSCTCTVKSLNIALNFFLRLPVTSLFIRIAIYVLDFTWQQLRFRCSLRSPFLSLSLEIARRRVFPIYGVKVKKYSKEFRSRRNSPAVVAKSSTIISDLRKLNRIYIGSKAFRGYVGTCAGTCARSEI